MKIIHKGLNNLDFYYWSMLKQSVMVGVVLCNVNAALFHFVLQTWQSIWITMQQHQLHPL